MHETATVPTLNVAPDGVQSMLTPGKSSLASGGAMMAMALH
jgi:hypothetical protein